MASSVPMKEIKVGTNGPPRIAQACDRCRSKKIRCDGVRPTCTQCASVGFECRTSDKLSRRAFPRGYTESLEERIRSLEAEIRHLRSVVTEKDAEIERLSKIQRDRGPSSDPALGSSPAYSGSQTGRAGSMSDGSHFESILTTGQDMPGARLQRFEVNRLKQKLSHRHDIEIQTYCFLPPTTGVPQGPASLSHPPKPVTDHLVELFFGTWASLFPILSRGHFMEYYRLSLADQNHPRLPPYGLAQIFLVLSITENSQFRDHQPTDESLYYARRWMSAMDGISSYWKSPASQLPSSMVMPILQTLLLAAIECLQTTNVARLSEYMAAAFTLCVHLRLHHSQDEQTELTPYERETRKRVFWCHYTLESFAAFQLELEMRMANMNISCEFPDDRDVFNDAVPPVDVAVPEVENNPPLSSALGLSRLARVLTQIWGDIGPPSYTMAISSDGLGSRLISFQTLLEVWLSGLPCQHQVQRFLDRSGSVPMPDRNAFFLRFAFSTVSVLIPKVAIRVSEWTSLSASYILICKQALQVSAIIKDNFSNVPLPLNFPYQIIQFIIPILTYALDKPFGDEEIEETATLIRANLTYLRTTPAANAAAELSSLIDKVFPKWSSTFSKQKGKGSKGVSSHESSSKKSDEVSLSEWAELVGRMDGGDINIYDNIYGGPRGYSISEENKLGSKAKSAGAGTSKPVRSPPSRPVGATNIPPVVDKGTTSPCTSTTKSKVSGTHAKASNDTPSQLSTQAGPSLSAGDSSLLPRSSSQTLATRRQSVPANAFGQRIDQGFDISGNIATGTLGGDGTFQSTPKPGSNDPSIFIPAPAGVTSTPSIDHKTLPTNPSAFQFTGSSPTIRETDSIPAFAPSLSSGTVNPSFLSPTFGSVEAGAAAAALSHPPFSPSLRTTTGLPTFVDSVRSTVDADDLTEADTRTETGTGTGTGTAHVDGGDAFPFDGAGDDLSALLDPSQFNFGSIYHTSFSSPDEGAITAAGPVSFPGIGLADQNPDQPASAPPDPAQQHG